MLDYVNIGARETHIGLIRNVAFGIAKLAVLIALVAIGVKESTTTLLSVWIWASAFVSFMTLVFLLPRAGHQNSWPTHKTWICLCNDLIPIVWNYFAMVGGAVIPYLCLLYTSD